MIQLDEKQIDKRIEWLTDKVREMRRPQSPDYTPSDILRGRIEGQIGQLQLIRKGRIQ